MNYYFYGVVNILESNQHIILYGKEGAGKRTILHKGLSRLLGYDTTKCNYVHEYIKVETNTKNIELNAWLRKGKHHIELDMYNTQKSYDMYFVSHMINQATHVKLNDKGELSIYYIMLHHFENASHECKCMLRRSLEKNKYVKLLITTTNYSSIPSMISSRCCSMRIPLLKDIPQMFWVKKIQIDLERPLNKIIIEYRSIFYELLILCINPADIMKELYRYFRMSNKFEQISLINIFASCEHQMCNSQKIIYHIEYCIYLCYTKALLLK